MQFKKLNDSTFIIRLEKGEEVISTLTNFASENNISNASFTAIGSVENPKLAHYRVDTKKYSDKVLSGIYEVTSMIGNIALFENKQLIHAHGSFSDEEMRGFGGHIVEATVSATLEVILNSYFTKLGKTFNEEIGLKLWDLSD